MDIIGQKSLLTDIDRLIYSDNFPRFSIIQGAYGGGKKLLSSYIAQKLNAIFIPCELAIDSVRDIIDTSYTLSDNTVYMFAEADKMSLGAKNAMLKITEEPPNNAYFIMTTQNINNLLNTLISRATVFNLNPYTLTDLTEYIKLKYPKILKKTKLLNKIVNVALTPADIQELTAIDTEQMCNIVDILCENIGQTNLANELKLSTFLNLKDSPDLFNPVLFMRTCMIKYSDLMLQTNNPIYAKLVNVTSKYITEMTSKSLNKTATVDNWIIDMHLIAERDLL